MKMIVGLGNVGSEYERTRHNVGFVVVEKMSGSAGWNNQGKSMTKKEGEVLFVKPQTFMNRSGEAVSELARFYKLGVDEIWVIHDDLDIVLGDYKIQKGVGPKSHNGILSVEGQLGDDGFWRVRVGVDARGNDVSRVSGEDYVLSDFSSGERKILDEVIEKIIEEIKNGIRI